MWMDSQMPWWHGCHRTAMSRTVTAASTPDHLSLRFGFTWISKLIYASKLTNLRMKVDYIFLFRFWLVRYWLVCWRSHLHCCLLPAAGLCVDTSARRRKHIHVGSTKTSLFWKLAAVSTPVHKSLRFGFTCWDLKLIYAPKCARATTLSQIP